ncbi:class I SAM-dependent methyltransferase [Micromonospora sp. NPDC050200]|uniref:class I SAM-dependent methyltransferase n=1 Tax=Micromonospora sp. NPDC050200 TaxID=3155664 RepID=UPI0033DDE8EB
MSDDLPGATLNPFRVPSGPLGRLAGWVMGRDDSAHRQVLGLLAAKTGACVCEIGFGPGQLLKLLVARDSAVQVCGVDPSPVMLAQAHRRLSRLGAAERADLRLGVAGALPFPDRHADHVVAVNTAAMWPDLQAALVDTRRVLRPGGTLLIAWHSARSPRRIQRTLAQPEAWWGETATALRQVFGNVERHDLTYTTACTATAS